MKLARLGERGLLEKIFREFKKQRGPGIVLGPGDDAAVSKLRRGRVLVSTHDDLVEGSHFERRWADFRRLGHKLWRVNLSDLAAMGEVEPLGVLVSAGLPAGAPESWALDFLKGIAEDGRRFKTPVLGGNLAKSDRVFLSMTALGQAKRERLLYRSGAKAGDLIAGVGPLGAAGRALAAVRAGKRSGVEAFWEPEPQLRAGKILGGCGFVHSLIDNSDGLSASCGWIAKLSGLAFTLDLSRAPLQGDPEAGEDYGLVFTLAERDWPALKRRLPRAYRLGRMSAPKKIPTSHSKTADLSDAFRR